MFGVIKSWFQSAEEPIAENKWDGSTVTMHQPNSPSASEMNNTVTEQPGASQSMDVHMRGGGAGEGICCGICAGLCCFECCECCCGDCCGDDGPGGPPGGPPGGGPPGW